MSGVRAPTNENSRADAVEKSVLSQHVHSTVPLNKQFASKETLDRIKTSQARARR